MAVYGTGKSNANSRDSVQNDGNLNDQFNGRSAVQKIYFLYAGEFLSSKTCMGLTIGFSRESNFINFVISRLCSSISMSVIIILKHGGIFRVQARRTPVNK